MLEHWNFFNGAWKVHVYFAGFLGVFMILLGSRHDDISELFLLWYIAYIYCYLVSGSVENMVWLLSLFITIVLSCGLQLYF